MCSYQKFKEGGKSIIFLTYDGTFREINKILDFIQQYDAAYGDEHFSKSSKLCNMAMYFEKLAHQWWSSLHAQGRAPRTWKALQDAIMKQFLPKNPKDKFLNSMAKL